MTKKIIKAKLLPEDWEAIVLNYTFGKSARDIALMLDITDQTCQRTIRVFNAVKAEDWDEVCKVMRINNISMNLVTWCAEKTGKEIPPEVQKDLEASMQAWRLKDSSRYMNKATQEPTDPPVAAANENLYNIKVLESLAKIIELLETAMDVVIPKYVNDIKDNINANTDVECERLKQIELVLEKIAKNTRPRGM